MLRGIYLMKQTSKAQAIREGSFGYLIQNIANRLDATMKSELGKVDVDVKLFAGLRMLAEQDGINQRELGRKLNFPEYFTSRNIDAMVEAGFAERRTDPNSRRSFLIFLTEDGKTKAESLPPIVRKVNDEILANLTGPERQQVIDLLKKVAGSSNQHKG